MSNRTFGPPLRFRLLNGDLQFFNGQGWISVLDYIANRGDVDTPDEIADDLATALEAAEAESE